MPAPIVLVHSCEDLLSRSADLLRRAGHEVATFTSSLSALHEIKSEGRLTVLVTGLLYPAGQPNGISLARMTLLHRPSTKIIFTVKPELREHVEFGQVLLLPVTEEQIFDAVLGALSSSEAVLGDDRGKKTSLT